MASETVGGPVVLDPRKDEGTTPLMVLERAVSSGANIETLERLMALSERWQANRARQAFTEALAALRNDLPPIIKSKTVDFSTKAGRTHYKYEDLAEITEALSPALSKHGLSFRWRTDSTQLGMVAVTCILAHSDGHSEETTLAGPYDTSGNKNAIQAIGSVVTYLQRYTIKAAIGVAAGADDDGRQGVGQGEAPAAGGQDPGAPPSEQMECPTCGKTGTIFKSKFDDGGWYCFAKRGGCGAKFKTWPPEEDYPLLLSLEQETVIREFLSSSVFDGDPVKEKTIARLTTMTKAKASDAIDWLKAEIKKRKAAMETTAAGTAGRPSGEGASIPTEETDSPAAADPPEADDPFAALDGSDRISTDDIARLDGLRVTAKVKRDDFDLKLTSVEAGPGTGPEKAMLVELWIHEQAKKKGVNLAPKPALKMGA